MTAKLKPPIFTDSLLTHEKLVPALARLEACAHDGKKMQSHILQIIPKLSSALKSCNNLDAVTSLRMTHLISVLDQTTEPGSLPGGSVLLQKMRFMLQRELICVSVLNDISDFETEASYRKFHLDTVLEVLSLFMNPEDQWVHLETLLKSIMPSCSLQGTILKIPCGHFPSIELLTEAKTIVADNVIALAVIEILYLYAEINEASLASETPDNLITARSLVTIKALKDLSQFLATESSMETASKIVLMNASIFKGMGSTVKSVFLEGEMALQNIPVSRQVTPILFDLYEFSKEKLGLTEEPESNSILLSTLPFLISKDQHTTYFKSDLAEFYSAIDGDAQIAKITNFLSLVSRIQACVDSKIKGAKAVFEPSKEQLAFISNLDVVLHQRQIQAIYPLSAKKLLCESDEEVELLPLATTKMRQEAFIASRHAASAHHLEAVAALDSMFATLAEVKPFQRKPGLEFKMAAHSADVLLACEAPKAKGMNKKPVHASGGCGVSSSSNCLAGASAKMVVHADETEEVDADLMTLASIQAAAGGGGLAPKPRQIAVSPASFAANPLQSLILTQRILPKSLKFHPRVASWFTSAEEGLKYYGCKEAHKAFAVSDEEMILRHRLPQALLIPLFDNHYSCAEEWHDGKNVLKKRSAKILINERAFTLQATLNRVGELYHFYAQPDDLAAEDEERLSEKAILALLGDQDVEATDLMSISGVKALEIDPATNNLVCVFEGNRYEIKFRA